MIALSFRTKLALAMMGLVAAVAAVTLLITENQVQVSYERHFEQAFTLQIESFLLQRAERLAPVQVRVAEAAGSPRLIAARVENPDDVNDLYVNGIDQLSDLLKAYPQGRTNSGQAFFFFLNNQGEVLSPGPGVKLPFVFPRLGRITVEVERIGQGVAQESAPQVGYLAPEDAAGIVRIREMVFTPIVDQVGLKKLGVLAVGLPLPETAPAIVIKAKAIPPEAFPAGAATPSRGS